jgi:hypothetical protein
MLQQPAAIQAQQGTTINNAACLIDARVFDRVFGAVVGVARLG